MISLSRLPPSLKYRVQTADKHSQIRQAANEILRQLQLFERNIKPKYLEKKNKQKNKIKIKTKGEMSFLQKV